MSHPQNRGFKPRVALEDAGPGVEVGGPGGEQWRTA